jgi:hypothetical protein
MVLGKRDVLNKTIEIKLFELAKHEIFTSRWSSVEQIFKERPEITHTGLRRISFTHYVTTVSQVARLGRM